MRLCTLYTYECTQDNGGEDRVRATTRGNKRRLCGAAVAAVRFECVLSGPRRIRARENAFRHDGPLSGEGRARDVILVYILYLMCVLSRTGRRAKEEPKS